MGLSDLFEDVFHIAAADYVPKPSPQTFERLVARHGVAAGETVFFEDSERNLKPAAELGMTTVLVGATAPDSTAQFVDYKTHDLVGFLTTARLRSR